MENIVNLLLRQRSLIEIAGIAKMGGSVKSGEKMPYLVFCQRKGHTQLSRALWHGEVVISTGVGTRNRSGNQNAELGPHHQSLRL